MSDLIGTIVATSDSELSGVLEGIPTWPWPRGDLYSWVPVLNKFDAYLESTVEEYNLKQLQTKELTGQTKANVMEILRVEKMLLEHCTNRKIFASFDVSIDLSTDLAGWGSVLLSGGGQRGHWLDRRRRGRSNDRADHPRPSSLLLLSAPR